MEADDQRIRVAIRVRCLSTKEKEKKKLAQWSIMENKLWQIDPKSENKIGTVYTFDHVFGMESLTKDIFEELVKPIVQSCVQGFNGTIFAYGQTSSGKTYTMMGDKAEDGVIPLSVNHIFKTVENHPTRDFLIRVSYMEIYNEQIKDLLEIKNCNLKIHEDLSGQAYVTLKEEITDTPEKVLSIMKKGEKNRTFGSTDINERSSRSHTIFRIIIESRKQQGSEASENFDWDDAMQVSILNLVDLAGSERVVQTKATGDRFKEGCAINKSLFYLGNVIAHLSEGSGQYVNFRDSKLTRILRTSLGGNAHTAIICTVTPASVEETISTLSFASRAMCVKNEPHVNEIITDECLMRRHAAMVKKLEQDLERARQDNECSNIKKELEEKEKTIRQLRDWIQRDQIRISSPRLVSRTDRRKTWAAPELIESLKRNHQITDRLGSLQEETADIDFSMESLMEEDEDETELSNISNRRGSSGNWKRVSRLPIRNSLQNTASCSSTQIRFSYDENIKKRKKEMEVFERLTTEEIKSSKKVLYEAITRLKGNRPVVDLNCCTLVELINNVGSIAETLEPMVNKSNSPLEGSKKLSSLESLLEKTKLELDKISYEKNELQSFLKLEQEKCFDIDNRLKEALEKLEEYSTVVEKNDELSKDIASMLEKSRIGEEELVSRLNEETDKVVKLRNELHAKILDLENQNAIVKECKVQLDEEKIKSELLEVKLKEALSKLGSCGAHVPAQLVKWAEEIIALKGQLEYCLHNFSNIKSAYNEWEHFSSFDVDVNLQLSLDIVQTVLMQLNELSEKLKSTDFNAESLPENETFKCTLEDSTHEMIPVECIKVEQKDMLNNTCESNKDVSMNCGLVDQGLDESVLLNYKEKVYGLEIELQKSNERLYNIMSEKRSIEDLLVIEREQLKNAEGRLQDASHQIETLICNVNEATEKSKSNEEILASKIAQQMERIIYLEDELEANEFVVANLAISEEEAILDLKEQTGKVKLLEEKLKEAEEKLMHVFEENGRIKTEMSIKENEMSAILSEQVKNISKLEGTVEEYKSKLDEMNALEGSYKTDVSSVITEYKEKILKLEEDTQRYSGELMKLGLEKGEIEAELVSEKERYGMVCMLLNETIAKMVNVNEELKTSFKIKEIEEPKTKEVSWEEIENIESMNDTSEELIAMENKEIYVEENCNSDQLQKNMKKVKELVQIFERYVVEISKVHLEKEELESMLQIAKEGHENIIKQLDQALNNAENLTKELNEASYKHKEVENRLESLMENESKKVKILEEDLEKKQTDLDKLSFKAQELDNLMSEELFANQVNGSEIASKMLNYEQKIAELEKVLLKNASDILVLESEKAELESIVIEVYANYDHASTELTEALGNVDILTKEYEESSVRHKEAEGMLESLLCIEKEKVRELQGKEIELEKLSSKLEQLDMLLNEERSKKEDVQTDVAGKISDYEEIIAKLTNELNESSTTHKETEDRLQCLINDEIEKVKNLKEDLEIKESVIEKFTSKIEELDTILNEERSKKDLMYLELTSKLTECEQKIAELQTEVSKYASDVSLLGLEKGELESLLVSEKENTHKLSAQLQEVLINLDNMKDLNQQTEKYREAEGMFESLLNSEQEKVRKMEADLESKEADLENFRDRIEELDSLLIEERSKKEAVQSDVAGKLSDYEEIVAKLSNDLKESSTTHKETEDMLQCLLKDEIEKVKNLKADLENKESDIEKFTSKIKELDIILNEERSKKELMYLELTEKLTECEQKIAKLLTEVSKYASDVSLLGLEKGELESLLVSEKENSQKLSAQLQDLDNVVKDLNEKTEKYTEAESMLHSLLREEKEKVIKLEADLESKEADLESLSSKIEELDSLLIEERSKKEDVQSNVAGKLSDYEEIVAKLSNDLKESFTKHKEAEDVLQCLLNDEIEKVKNLKEDLENKESLIEKLTLKIEELDTILNEERSKKELMYLDLTGKLTECEQKIAELQTKVSKYASDVSLLGLEKGEMESLLVSEKENSQKLSVQLQGVLSNLDNVVKDLNEQTEKYTEAESMLHSLLREEKEKVIKLEADLESKEADLENFSRKIEELDSLLIEERSKKEDVQSNVAGKLSDYEEIVAKLSNDLKESSTKHKEAEDVLQCLLNDEIEKVKNLKEDLENKESVIEKFTLKIEELDTILNEERSKKELMYLDLTGKLTECEQKIAELQTEVLKYASDVSLLGLEKGEMESLLVSEKENSQKLSVQLQGVLSNLDNVVKDLNEQTEKCREAEGMFESLLNNEKENVRKLEADLENLSCRIEELDIMLIEEKSKNDMFNSEMGDKISKYEQKIDELEMVVTKNTSDYVALGMEKGELESLLASEKQIVKNLTDELNESSEKHRIAEENLLLRLNAEVEKVNNYQVELQSKTVECTELSLKIEDYILQLQEQVTISEKLKIDDDKMQGAVHEIDKLICSQKKATEKSKSKEEDLASKLAKQIERIIHLEDELEATEFVVANLAISEEEAILDLKEQTGKVSWLEEKLKEAEEKLMCACEENDRIKAEMSTRILQEEAEGMLESLLSEEKEKVKKMEADLAIKEVDLETKDADLENLSCRLEELDQLLNEEKSKYEMFNSEIADKISKYEQKIDELEVVVSKNMSDNLTLGMEKGELESLLSFEKENCHKISYQLHEALSSLENLTKELSESAERHKEETDLLKSLLDEKIEMVEKLESELLTKESNLQTFCSEIEQLKMSLNEEISVKEVIKSDLANKTSEYEKIVKNLTEELNESSEKQRKTEENLILQLNTELEKVSNYQEELQSKTQECQKLSLKVEDYILQLQEQVAISDKKDVEIQQLLSKCNSFEEKVELFETCGLNTAEKVSEQAVRILELEVLVEECQQELNSFRSKNLDLESVLAAEKEKSEAVNSQLKDSLEKIDSLKMETEEAFEKCKVIEQELQLKSLEVEQMNGKTGEFDLLLKQEKDRCNEINKEMQKVLADFSVLKEEKEKLAVEFGEREKTLLAHEEEMKTQNVLMEQTKSELSSITLERDDLRNSLNSVQAKYDSTKGRLQNALQDIDTISNKLIEVANECESLRANKSEALSIKNELENAKYALSVCVKSEEDLGNLLTIEKDKVAELQKQLDEEKNKEKLAEDKNLEMSNSLLTLEAELKSLKDEHNNCVENESRWMKSNEVQFNELKELNVKLEATKSKIEKLEVMLESKVNDVAEAQKENDRVTLLLELGNKKISDLEDNIKVLNEKLHVKSQAFVDEAAKVAQLQYDLKDAENKLQTASEVNENKITMMESMLLAENKKYASKMEEVESLRVHTKELVELLKAKRGKVSMLEEEVKSLKTEIGSQLTDGNKLKVLEIELRSSIELEKKERVYVEKELEKVKSDLASSHLCQNELKSEIQCLAIKLQQETSKCVELRTLLDIEKEAHSSTREAEKRLVGVLSAQEKAISLIESVKGVAGTDTKALKDIIQEKENKIIELSEKLKEAEKFGKDMEEMAMKFERRRDIVLDHRMEIQNKAKETEDRLLKEIAELKSDNSRAEKCKCSEMEKELVAERFKIEGLQSKLQSALGEVRDSRSQVEEYKKELQRCKQLQVGVSRKNTNVIECGVQTNPITQSEVLDIHPDGSSVVQYYKIDLLEQKVKKLEEDKEILKKVCRRRHDQREELKIQVEALTNKIQGKEKRKENKENMNMNQ